jgi:hypothetical protein
MFIIFQALFECFWGIKSWLLSSSHWEVKIVILPIFQFKEVSYSAKITTYGSGLLLQNPY